MEALFEKVFGLLERWISYLLPFVILPDDFCGLVRRLGKYHRDIKHGWNWKWPIIEHAETQCSALFTTVLREQSLTTKDDIQITVRGVVTYCVVDPRKYILDCSDGDQVVNDIVCAVIAALVPRMVARDVLQEPDDDDEDGKGFTRKLLRKVRSRGKKWGIEVDSCGLVDRVATPTYRIISSSGHAAHHGSVFGE